MTTVTKEIKLDQIVDQQNDKQKQQTDEQSEQLDKPKICENKTNLDALKSLVNQNGDEKINLFSSDQISKLARNNFGFKNNFPNFLTATSMNLSQAPEKSSYLVTPRQAIRKRKSFILNQSDINGPSHNYDSVEFVEDLKRRKLNGGKSSNPLIDGSMFVWLSQFLTFFQRCSISYLHFANINTRIITYLAMIVIFGLIKEYVLIDSVLPSEWLTFIFKYIKSPKRSPLNVYFVKLGWLWTFIATIPFFLITRLLYLINKQNGGSNGRKIINNGSKNYNTMTMVPKESNPDKQTSTSDETGGDKAEDRKDENMTQAADKVEKPKQINFLIQYIQEIWPPFGRIILATLLWYFSVNLFSEIGKVTGHCQTESNTMVFLKKSIEECIKEGHKWIYGFDLSGHIFLMTFSNFIIIEELRYLLFRFEGFYEFRYLAKFDRDRAQRFVKPYHFRMDYLVHWTALLLTSIMLMIVLIWDYMMILSLIHI